MLANMKHGINNLLTEIWVKIVGSIGGISVGATYRQQFSIYLPIFTGKSAKNKLIYHADQLDRLCAMALLDMGSERSIPTYGG